jgi:hypothetical protein
MSLHNVNHNFARPHVTLTKGASGCRTTSAIAAGVADRVGTDRDGSALLD